MEESLEFQNAFLELLRTKHQARRVSANEVYKTYTQSPQHPSIQPPQWKSLNEFVFWLGQEGLCTVDRKPDGLHLAYIAPIHRTPAAHEREEGRRRHVHENKVPRESSMSVSANQAKDGSCPTPAGAPGQFDFDQTVKLQLPIRSRTEHRQTSRTNPRSVVFEVHQVKKRTGGTL
ncbi:C2H2 finger domain-containing protein [Colletotrichum chrysophilum]|uniref:C2H2 finger domain-containing protein n=1 Tax=Colletotrichum chrysophilum TaxID=1836956 RepID=A0AAD9EHP5_9PEZI|nr:C2H2 finger domain-containing protein [Colletotrichum chrysophilum]